MRRILIVALLALAAAPSALAGGPNVAVVAAHGQVWATDGASALELDSTTGHVLRRVRGRYPYADDVQLGSTAIWMASVEQGFVAASITRIPLAGSKATSPLVLPNRPVFSLATDGRAAWALVGPWTDPRLARIENGKVRMFSSQGAAFLSSGSRAVYGLRRWGGVLRFGHDGHATTIARIRGADGPPIEGAGSLWVPRRSTLVRLDRRSGRVVGSISLGGLVDTVTFGAGAAWAVVLHDGAFRLERIDTRAMRVVATRTIANRGPRLAYGNGRLWLADGDLGVWTVDPHTLALKLFARLD